MNLSIPSINFKQLNEAETVNRLHDACRDWGFFKLIDHPISPLVSETLMQTMRQFFAQTQAAKQAVSRDEENPWGYFDKELTKNRQDWKEIFDLGRDQVGPYASKTPWPADIQDFQKVMLDWHQRCEAIAISLIKAICSGLSNDPGTLIAAFRPRNSSFLRLNHYPICTDPSDPGVDFPDQGHLGISHHTDAGALTILLPDEVPGLQVRYCDHWHTIDSGPGSLIVNVGDLVQVWSNNQHQAPLHRVLANPAKERFSAAFFLNPTFETLCQPLVAENPCYRPFTWGEFRGARAAGDYANQGKEIQIANYLL